MATLLDFSAPHPLNWVQLTLDFPLREGSGVSALGAQTGCSLGSHSEHSGHFRHSPEAAVGCDMAMGQAGRQGENTKGLTPTKAECLLREHEDHRHSPSPLLPSDSTTPKLQGLGDGVETQEWGFVSTPWFSKDEGGPSGA